MGIVENLTRETYNDFLQQNKLAMVAFILPFVTSTPRFVSEFEAAATALTSSDVHCAVVDCQKEDGFGPFNRWPNVKLFNGLEYSQQYEGAWKASDLVAWTKRQLRPTVSEVNAQQLSDLQIEDQVIVVGCFPLTQGRFRQPFASIAEDLRRDYVFGLDRDASIAQREQIREPSIVIFKNYDENKTVIQLPTECDELRSQIKSICEPLLVEIRPEIHKRFIDRGLPIAYMLTDGSAEQQTFARILLEMIAENNRGKIIFGIADVHLCDSLAEDLHLDESCLPAFAIKDIDKGRFPFIQDQLLSTDSINSFVMRFVRGELRPTVKSEPKPEDQDGYVTIVVGSTYNDIVINNHNDVLLNYSTQLCGPCKAMYPKYESLARLYATDGDVDDRVTIAKVDAELNDVPGDIRGFPTFKLFPARAKDSPILYLGPWTVEGFVNFIKENGSHRIDVLENCTWMDMP